MTLIALPVDPRDISWEVERPTFRVYLWRRSRLEDVAPEHRPTGLRQADMGWQSSEWELTGGTVDEALTWVDEHLTGWDVADVWVVVPDPGEGRGKGLIRIRGYNPNETTTPVSG